ncbi:MAG: TrkH family potassium uptake protein [Phascolarctobacterium sp.]|nr:TrkH family potassium uptake protein [Phascolarctobacterium sp.]
MYTKIIAYLLSRLSLGLCAVLSLPFTYAVLNNEPCFIDFLYAIMFSGALYLALGFYGKDANRKDISVREGIGTVFFAWLLAALIAALPFVFSGILDPISAFFESMSGLTTTGSTVINNLELVPSSILLWRSLTHWIGGIGIIVLFVALLPQIAGSAVYLFNAEVSGFSSNRILPRIHTTAMALFGIYTLMTVVLIIALMCLGMNSFDAVNHACSAIATGGFSTYNDSVAHFDSAAIEFVLGFAMIMAGGNFALYYYMVQSGVKSLINDIEFKAYLGLLVCVTAMITWNIVHVNDFSFFEGFRYAFFQVASFGSTTGFVSYNYDEWPAFSKLLLALMYFTGACAGSTAGGIKICRFVVLVKTVFAELRRAMHPQMLLTVYYNNRILPVSTIINIGRFFFMYVLVIVVLSFALSFTGLSVEDSLFGVASCISSVGPAFGTLGAISNYAEVTPMGKIVLSVAMLLGRLELFTVLALLRSEYWSKSKRW